MARLANSAVQLCQRLQEMYPQKFQFPSNKSEQSSPFRRWTTGSGAGASYRHQDHRGIYSKQMSEGSPPLANGCGGGGCGGVARWSLGLEQLLADPAGAAAFTHFLAKEYAAENIRFWWACEQYRTCEADERRSSLAADIWQTHFAEKATEPVNVDAAARRAVELRLHQAPAPQDLFLQAQKQIFNVMKFDSYPRFLRSGVHAECARADLRGLPPPYQPAHYSTHTDTPKLKKSSSSASDRRRSGASLLPWRARAASRDRADSAHSAHSAADDSEAAQAAQAARAATCPWSGNAALCRVVLPDGATSVVGVAPDVSVRRLVERLLQRRNLACAAYDVIVKDADQDGGRALDASCASTEAGGRCLVVERRVVLRVLVAGRAVCVRCRPARRLRHVLRPVLQRYCPPLAARYAALLGAAQLHPDTVVQELDGARIHIVELPGAEHEPRDDDADSLSDLALRVHDDTADDAQSAGRSSGCSAGGADAAAARVRAALRPGPPLHHHPPDFLDNLRETQRQRLQPRTPPPLPPKPPQRAAPTVV